ITHTTKEGLKKQRKKLKQTKIEPKNLFDYAEEVIIPAKIKQEWMNIFNLKNIDEPFIPHIPNEVKEYVGKDLLLTKNSLIKLIANKREKYIKDILPTLEKPEIVIKHEDSIIFARELNDKLFFTSVGKDFDAGFIVASNAPKKRNNLINKATNENIIYQSPNFGVLRYDKLLQTDGLLPTRLNSDNSTPNHLKKPLDFESFHDEEKSLRTRFKDNIEAMSLLKELMQNNTQATQEQQAILAKYLNISCICLYPICHIARYRM
ncbi:hypothetical protein CCZ01_07665, partial [Helicobacter monodelphidis]|uniref:PBECR2 nuclease fold domain-containing protein n=1 Tax=Helicobacter sp. 15-1451 TaxID=2004995 RepID=UPI000DCDCF95